MADKPRGVWLLVQAPDEATDRCYLFTDIFSRLLQVALAGWSIFLLYVKRQLEFPKRPLLVWAFDVSKQCFASLFLHCMSILAAVLLVQRADEVPEDDECGVYFLTYVLDATVGLSLVVLLLRLVHLLAERFNWENIVDSGYYGDPPRCRVWWRQAMAFLTVIATMKGLDSLLLWLLCPWLAPLATQLFQSFSHHRHLELSVVMIIVPGLSNAVQFWILDSQLKTSAEHWGYKLTSGAPDEKFWIQRGGVVPSMNPGCLTPPIPEQPTVTSPL